MWRNISVRRGGELLLATRIEHPTLQQDAVSRARTPLARRRLYGGVLLAHLALGLLAFGPVIGAFFLSDDFFYLSAIAHSHGPDVLLLQPGVFRPLHVASWLLDYRLWGMNPIGYHLTNIVGHCIAAFLVFLVAKHLLGRVASEPVASSASVLAGLVFLLHPSHTEAVSWIIGRHDVFATLFVLCSWLAYAQFRRTSRRAYVATSVAAFLVALLFKESVITFPLVLVAHETWVALSFGSRANRPILRGVMKWPGLYLAVVVVYLLARRLFTGDVVAGYELAFVRPTASTIFANGAATVFRSFFPYIPVQLLPVAPRIGLSNIGVVVVGVAGLATGLALIYRTWTHPTPIRLLVGFLSVSLLLCMLPTIGGGASLIDSEGERYAYLPSVFASILVGLLLATVARHRALGASLVVVVLLVEGAFLELSNENWRKAGELSQGILAAVQAEPGEDQPAILLVPDSLNGAFIFRNGLQEAQELLGPPGAAIRAPAGWVFLNRADDVISLERVDPARYTLSLPGGRGVLRLASAEPYPALSTTSVSPLRFDVVPHEPVRVAYYSAGGMRFAELTPR